MVSPNWYPPCPDNNAGDAMVDFGSFPQASLRFEEAARQAVYTAETMQQAFNKAKQSFHKVDADCYAGRWLVVVSYSYPRFFASSSELRKLIPFAYKPESILKVLDNEEARDFEQKLRPSIIEHKKVAIDYYLEHKLDLYKPVYIQKGMRWAYAEHTQILSENDRQLLDTVVELNELDKPTLSVGPGPG